MASAASCSVADRWPSSGLRNGDGVSGSGDGRLGDAVLSGVPSGSLLLTERAWQSTAMEEEGPCSTEEGDAPMVDGELRRGKLGNLPCFEISEGISFRSGGGGDVGGGRPTMAGAGSAGWGADSDGCANGKAASGGSAPLPVECCMDPSSVNPSPASSKSCAPGVCEKAQNNFSSKLYGPGQAGSVYGEQREAPWCDSDMEEEDTRSVGVFQPLSVVAPAGGGAAGILGAGPGLSGKLIGVGALFSNGHSRELGAGVHAGSEWRGADVVHGISHIRKTVDGMDLRDVHGGSSLPVSSTPGACGNAWVHSAGLTPSAAKASLPTPHGLQGNAWSRPQVVALPSRVELGEFAVEGNSVQLDEEVLQVNIKKLESAIVGRLFGKKIPFFQLRNELQRRWARFGNFRLVTLTADCFICYFGSVAVRDSILSCGPWVIAGQVLGLDKWSSSFSPSSMAGFITPVWVRLPALPFYCWDPTNIARIASVLGEPLWVDAATNSMERGAFARVCVKLDLSKPLLAGVSVSSSCGNFFQKTEYEGLSTLCFRCGHVGHKVASCTAPPWSKTAHLKDPVGGSSAAVCTSALPSRSTEVCHPSSPVMHDSGGMEGHNLGPWTVVQRRKPKAAPKGLLRPGPRVVDPAVVLPGVAKGEEVSVAQAPIPLEVVQQPLFGGFKATATDSLGRAASCASHRMGRRSSRSQSAHSQDLVRGLCELPSSDLSLMDQDAPVGTIVPYCQRLYVDEPPPLDSDVSAPLMIEGSHGGVEGGLEEGHRSLKVERMLKDLGPVSSLPRKRRLVALDLGGGDAFPSLPP